MPDGDSSKLGPAAPELAACPLCRTLLPPAAIEDHLRRSHGLFTHKGVHRSRDATFEAMLDEVVSPRADGHAWQDVVRLAREEYGPAAGRFLSLRLKRALVRVDPKRLPATVAALAPVVAPGNLGLVLTLARSKKPAARRLALLGFPHFAGPLDRRARRALRGLLAEPSLPIEDRIAAAAAALPHVPPRRAARMIAPMLRGRRRAAMRLVDRIEAAAGALPVLAELRERLGSNVRMSCPRCAAELRRNLMLPHLWREHGLLLEGGRVRDPWGVVGGWLDSAKAGDRRLVERCRVAVEKIDPHRGQAKLARLLLARGLADTAARHAALTEARERHASRCPACFAFVPVSSEQPALAIKDRPDRLLAGGYRVEIDETGLRPRLEVVTPSEVIFDGVEPDRPWTADGAAFVYTLLVVLASLLCAMLWPSKRVPSLVPVLVLLLVAFLVYRGVKLLYWGGTPTKERVMGFTWRLLVPELHAGGFRADDSAFAAGLAVWHSRRARADSPAEEVERLIEVTAKAVERGDAPAGHLAALVRLGVELSAEADEDPVPEVARWVGRCFSGKLPLSFAQRLLEDWPADWWTKANLARLRVLVCDRAFAAGFEVRTLIDAGRNAPALGSVLGSDAPRSLAALRLVWSMRASRPWDRLGAVRTAFDLASDAGHAEAFADRPDLLLYQEDTRTPIQVEGGRDSLAPARLRLTLAGLWVQEIIFSIPPRVFEVRLKTFGSQLILGVHTFRSSIDLDPFSRGLERWLRWVFHEFLPQVDGVLAWHSPHHAALLRAWGAVPCPECGLGLLPAVGEVGLAVS